MDHAHEVIRGLGALSFSTNREVRRDGLIDGWRPKAMCQQLRAYIQSGVVHTLQGAATKLKTSSEGVCTAIELCRDEDDHPIVHVQGATEYVDLLSAFRTKMIRGNPAVRTAIVCVDSCDSGRVARKGTETYSGALVDVACPEGYYLCIPTVESTFLPTPSPVIPHNIPLTGRLTPMREVDPTTTSYLDEASGSDSCDDQPPVRTAVESRVTTLAAIAPKPVAPPLPSIPPSLRSLPPRGGPSARLRAYDEAARDSRGFEDAPEVSAVFGPARRPPEPGSNQHLLRFFGALGGVAPPARGVYLLWDLWIRDLLVDATQRDTMSSATGRLPVLSARLSALSSLQGVDLRWLLESRSGRDAVYHLLRSAAESDGV